MRKITIFDLIDAPTRYTPGKFLKDSRPWEKECISRATWFRNQKRARAEFDPRAAVDRLLKLERQRENMRRFKARHGGYVAKKPPNAGSTSETPSI